MNLKVKNIFATVLCCSLFASSLNGISAIAETTHLSTEAKALEEKTQVDSLPTVQGNSASLIPTLPTILSMAPQSEEPALEEKSSIEVGIDGIDNQEQEVNRLTRATKTVDIPAKTYKLAFIDEDGSYIDPAKVSITGDVMKVEPQGTSGKVGEILTTNDGNLKEMTVPKVTLADDDSTGNTGFSGIQNSKIVLPGYYETPQVTPNKYYTGATFPMAQAQRISLDTGEVKATDDTGARFMMRIGTSPKQYEFSQNYWVPDTSITWFVRGFSMATTAGANDYFTTNDTIYYYVPKRRVGMYFYDGTGTLLPAYPTGYNSSLSTTIVDSENYHFKAPKALPQNYTANGRYFKFKGWYKGATKPDPNAVSLNTSLTPEFDNTYDGTDRVFVFYDEVSELTTTIPEVTYQFGFVDEKGAMISPANFDMKTNVTTVMNETPQNVGTATGVDVGNLKQLTIPSQQLTYVPQLKIGYSGATNFRLTIPKYYKTPSVSPGTYYTGATTTYPLATTKLKYVNSTKEDRPTSDGSRYLLVSAGNAGIYKMTERYWNADGTKTLFAATLSQSTTESNPIYFTTDDPMYYFLENRRITEHYVDDSGAEIAMPDGFTQGKKTVIDSENYHFKVAKELPYSYYKEGKAYRFKGWYKGKTKPTTLATTRTPEYDATLDDEDDLTVVYESIKYGGNTVQFGFVGEDGQLISPTGFKISTDVVQSIDGVNTVLSNVSATDGAGNLKNLIIPQKEYPLTPSINFFGTKNSIIEIPRQYQEISFNKPASYQGTEYVVAGRIEDSFGGNKYEGGAEPPYFAVSKQKANLYKIIEFYWKEAPTQTYSNLYKATLLQENNQPRGVGMYPDAPIYYYATNRRVTETFVDKAGAKITPPEGFSQDNQVIINSDPFTYTASQALPPVYSVGEKVYKFVGWYKGKTKPTTLTTTVTPSYQVTFDDNDNMTAVYEEETPTAALTLTSTNRVVNNGDSVDWVATLKNTSLAPLKTITVKPTTTWPAGIGTPTSLSVQLEGQAPKVYPVTETTWVKGISLTGLEIPAGQTANVTLVGTKISGTSDQRLTATLDVTGNFATVSAADAVRLTDTTQGTITPTAEGFISVPTFDFGKLPIASTTKQSGLKKAADYYENGTRNPYLRIKKNQPNWQLTAQLSQPKATTDSLPTATRLLLGAASVSSFTNYNEATEQIKAIGNASSLSLTANNVATSVIADKQFTGSDVYQLDFQFDNIKLEVPANQGMAGQQYQAAVTWNLVTGP